MTKEIYYPNNYSDIADIPKELKKMAESIDEAIPTTLAELTDDSTHRTVSDVEKTNWNNKSDFSGDYEDLLNKPSIPSKTSDLNNDNGFIDKNVNNLTNYTLKTSTGSLIDLEINQSTYVVTLKLKDVDGNIISTDTLDLPIENMVVTGSFDNVNNKIVLTLENGNTVDIPVGDLVAGLQTEITSQNKLASDLVDDTNSGNKFTNTSEKQTWNAKYDKPVGGIPKTDLSSGVQDSLDKADSSIQEEDLTDYVKNTDYATSSKGGVIKTQAWDGTAMDSGFLIARNITTYNNYFDSLASAGFVSKGTLETVLKNSIILKGTTTPTTSTVGYRVGQLYLNTTDNKVYQLVNIDNTNSNNIVYTWQQLIREQDIIGKEDNSNKVTSINSSSTDTQYPTAKCVYDLVGDIESILEELDVGGGA